MLSNNILSQSSSPYTSGYQQKNSVDSEPFNPGVVLILVIGVVCAIAVLFKVK
jgi:hypothetical protein